MSNTLTTLRRVARFLADVVHYYNSPDEEPQRPSPASVGSEPHQFEVPRVKAPHLASWDNLATEDRTQRFINNTIARVTGYRDDEDNGR